MRYLVLLTGGINMVGCSSIPGGMFMQVSVNKGKTITIHDMSDKTGWGSGSHIFMTRVSNERIAMTYWIAGDGAYAGTSNMDWPAYSDDNGQKWIYGNPFNWSTPPPSNKIKFAISKGENFSDFTMGSFFSRAEFTNGTVVLFSTGIEMRHPDYFTRIVSRDGGKSWEPPDPITIIWPESMTQSLYYLCFEHDALVVDSNTMYTVAYGGFAPSGKATVYLFESTDFGKTLTLRSTVAQPSDAPWGNNGPCEPSLMRVSSNSLLCIMRTGILSGSADHGKAVAESLLMSRSNDGGQTWKHKRMYINGVMPKLRRLSNGLIVLATGRPGNSLYISSDDGRSFGREITITAPHIKTTGYCDVMEVSPDKILVIYDIINSPLQKVWLWEPTIGNGIYGTYYTIDYRLGGDH